MDWWDGDGACLGGHMSNAQTKTSYQIHTYLSRRRNGDFNRECVLSVWMSVECYVYLIMTCVIMRRVSFTTSQFLCHLYKENSIWSQTYDQNDNWNGITDWNLLIHMNVMDTFYHLYYPFTLFIKSFTHLTQKI